GRYFLNVSVEEVVSTAHVAKMAVEDVTFGAIFSSLVKEVYDFQVVVGNIEDQSNNIMCFLVIGDKDAAPSKNDKTSLVFSVRDQFGVLHCMFQLFARSRINLSKIESCPIKNKFWEYMFFFDLKGYKEEP